MNYNYPDRKNSGTITIKVVCAVCFLLFSFLWLYEFQADILAVAQHVLSGGLTTYHPMVGAIIITLVLLLFQWLVASFIRFPSHAYALSYVPSMLVIAFISAVNADIDESSSSGIWFVVPPVLFVWGGLVWLTRQMSSYDTNGRQSMGFFSKRVWSNMLQMAVMMFMVNLYMLAF